MNEEARLTGIRRALWNDSGSWFQEKKEQTFLRKELPGEALCN